MPLQSCPRHHLPTLWFWLTICRFSVIFFAQYTFFSHFLKHLLSFLSFVPHTLVHLAVLPTPDQAGEGSVIANALQGVWVVVSPSTALPINLADQLSNAWIKRIVQHIRHVVMYWETVICHGNFVTLFNDISLEGSWLLTSLFLSYSEIIELSLVRDLIWSLALAGSPLLLALVSLVRFSPSFSVGLLSFVDRPKGFSEPVSLKLVAAFWLSMCMPSARFDILIVKTFLPCTLFSLRGFWVL